MNSDRQGSIKYPVIVERDNLLALVSQNSALNLKVSEMHLRESRLVLMIAALLNTADITMRQGREATMEGTLRERVSASIIDGVVRDWREMNP